MGNLRIGRKLTVAFGVIITFTLIITVLGAFSVMSVNMAFTNTYEGSYRRDVAIKEMRYDLLNLRKNELAATLYTDDTSAVRTYEAEIRALKTAIDSNGRFFAESIMNDRQVPPDVIATHLNQVQGVIDALELYYANVTIPVFEAVHANDRALAARLIADGSPYLAAVNNSFDALARETATFMEEMSRQNRAAAIRTMWKLIAVSFIAIVTAIIFGRRISKTISEPLVALTKLMQKGAVDGDFELTYADKAVITKHAQTKDEVGRLMKATGMLFEELNKELSYLEDMSNGDLRVVPNVLSERDILGISLTKLLNRYNEMFGKIRITSELVEAGSHQISEGAQSLAHGSAEQSAAVEELSIAISEIAAKTQVNAERATEASVLADVIKANAEKGSTQMDNMVGAVDEISQASQSVIRVVKVIDDIAFQTNILALNAAVEAARAGQHGKGFAVVADEVRTLAAQSAEAAKETNQLISNSLAKAKYGATIAQDTAKSLEDIVAGINESGEVIAEIARASEAQAASITQVNDGISQVALVVQQTSNTAQESAATAEELSAQSSSLKEMVGQFKVRNSAY